MKKVKLIVEPLESIISSDSKIIYMLSLPKEESKITTIKFDIVLKLFTRGGNVTNINNTVENLLLDKRLDKR